MNAFAPAFTVLLVCNTIAIGLASDVGPEFLSYEELIKLSATAVPEGEVGRKLNSLLTTPSVRNLPSEAGMAPRRPLVPGLGPVVRVALWNLERGNQFELIRSALQDPAGFKQAILSQRSPDPNRMTAAERQLEMLQDLDILVAIESDLGVSRSGYRDVAGELASALQMSRAYGVEFVEIDPLLLGLKPAPEHDEGRRWRDSHQFDPARFRGLHGNAVMSRYPILSARILRLPECYDWYGREKKEIAKLESGRRWAIKEMFKERVSREVRHGGRMALIVRLDIPEFAETGVTVVAVHLEDRARPACRQRQMDELLRALAPEPGPVILAGDLNTTGTNSAPTSIRRELTRRLSSMKFWIKQGLHWATPVGLAQYGLIPLNIAKNLHDPTVFHLPILLPNREARLFGKLKRFRFDDGGAFDFSGTAERSGSHRRKTLANSNQRSGKGFVPTFRFERTYAGLLGKYKLDWFFIKPAKSRSNATVRPFAPHFPVTMKELNGLGDERISDHPPMTVDLPLTEYQGDSTVIKSPD